MGCSELDMRDGCGDAAFGRESRAAASSSEDAIRMANRSFDDVSRMAASSSGDAPQASASSLLAPSLHAGASSPGSAPRIAVFCVGNKLLLDEGVGPAVYEEVMARYDMPETVTFHDVGCMSLDMLPYVEECDAIITVDAADATGCEPGTVLRYKPDDLVRSSNAMASLHDLRLADLFDRAALLGYKAEGVCFGMQVENMSPAQMTIGLTPRVHEALPRLVEAVAAELAHRGVPLVDRATGCAVTGPRAEGSE